MFDGTGLSEHLRNELKTVYHQHHESVVSFWGVYELLSTAIGLSISPPMLASLLRNLGVNLIGIPAEYHDHSASLSVSERSRTRSSTLLLRHLYSIVEEVTSGNYSDAFGDDDMLLLRLALQNENLSPSDDRHSSSLIRSLLPESVRARLSNFVVTGESNENSTDNVVDVEAAWKFISTLRNSHRTQSMRSFAEKSDENVPHKEAAATAPECLTKDMAKLFQKVHSDGGNSSETTSQQTGGTRSQGFNEISPLKATVSKTSLLRVRKSFSHALDFSKSSREQQDEAPIEERAGNASPMSPTFSDSGDENSQIFIAGIANAMAPPTLVPRAMTFELAAGAAEAILREASRLEGNVDQVLLPGELDDVGASLADAERRKSALLTRHESVLDLFEHRKRTTRLSSITFANSGAFGERRPSLVSFDATPVTTDDVCSETDATERWKRLKRSIVDLRSASADSSQLSHRSIGSEWGGSAGDAGSISTTSRPSTSSGFTTYLSEKKHLRLSRDEKVLLQSKRVKHETLLREIRGLHPSCGKYLDRDISKILTAKQELYSPQRSVLASAGSSKSRHNTESKFSSPVSRPWSPATVSLPEITPQSPSDNTIPLSRPDTPHWARWTTGGR
ncbi:Hypothetical protein, putative [Bodo saltans]|uniref:Uncharacterized protein n=1 Tax=Bodo saltans TaxID=75058 RepID=A0A0S4IUG3_BODSA|nr:Hypothetical protein, putative [Bodo saltans]|eukprot:CUF96859.1 Hypothetical protein, putative [Bodo saltans]